jgi:hypothetical protein
MTFDAGDRYLMGFMGSVKKNNVLELGPIVSKKIVKRIFSEIEL